MRVSTSSNYDRVLAGLRMNLLRMVRSQEQVASGRRILRPSDDPSGAARSLSLSRRIADADRFLATLADGQDVADAGAAQLETGSGLLAEARELLLQGMSGVLSQEDRTTLAAAVDVLREQMLDVANSRHLDRFLFGGTATGDAPFETVTQGGVERVVYTGNGDEQSVRLGSEGEVALNVAGDDVFAKLQASGIELAGLTGIAAGTTANQGTGWETLTLRHDATDPGALAGVGVALVAGGADDTLLGDQTLVIDAAAGTVQMGNGTQLSLPPAGDPELADLAVENERGGVLHLDLSAWSGADFSGTVSGSGSIAIDGASFVPIDFAQTDLRLVHPESGNVVHVDLTGVTRAGEELVQFGGAVNVFDVLEGIASDLRNGAELDSPEVFDRLELRLGELDRNQDNLLAGLGTLGSRSSRMAGGESRIEGLRVQLEGLRSETEDADLSQVVLDLSQAEQTLQLAQATGVRLIQNTLLRYL